MRKLLVLAALVVPALFVALGSTLAQRPDRRNWEYFPDMARSAAYRSQSTNAFLPDGATQLAPVAGTIPQGPLPLAQDASVRGFVLAGRELHSPFGPEHPPDLERAHTIFQTYCQVCHGKNAEGDGPAVLHGFPRPPSLLFGKALNMQDGHIFHIVTNGFRKMPSYASQIEPEERWLAIAYVRSLQRNAP